MLCTLGGDCHAALVIRFSLAFKDTLDGAELTTHFFNHLLGSTANGIHGQTAENESHVWNEIKLDNEWYHTDVTWNDGDSENIILYRYFNITDTEIKKDHKISPLYSAVSSKDFKEDTALNWFDIKAVGEKYNYYEYYSLKLDGNNYRQLASAIVKDRESGCAYTQFAVYDEVQLSGFESGKSFTKLQRALNLTSYLINPPKIEKYSSVDNIILLFW